MTREEEITKGKNVFIKAVLGDLYLPDTEKLCELSFKAGAEWADKTLIEKACEWLTLNIGMLLKVLDVKYNTNETDVKDFIEDFRKAMVEK